MSKCAHILLAIRQVAAIGLRETDEQFKGIKGGLGQGHDIENNTVKIKFLSKEDADIFAKDLKSFINN